MKTIHIALIFTLSLTFFACDPSLVDEPPLGATENTYFSDVNEFRSQLAGVYASLYDDYHFAAVGYNGWITSNFLLPGDDLTENNAARTDVELFDGSLNPNNGRIRYTFQTCYKTIARANVTIDKVRTVDFSDFAGADEIAKMEGEALFLRAYSFYKLFNFFGSVPIVNERIRTEETTNTPKSPDIDVLNQVIQDCEAAIQSLPEEWPAEQAGRVTKNSARGLLAKALVFRANYTGDNDSYGQALSVYNSMTSSLTADFIDNFNSYTENNEESLFEIQATVPSSGNNNLQLHNDGAWRGVENCSVYRGYMMEFGGRGDFNDASSTKFFITDKLSNNFGNDPRINVFINSEDGFGGKIFQKYNKPDGVNELSGFHGGSLNNERVLRYADLVLIAAEAELKSGNPAKAIEYLNQIRTRARTWGAESGYGDGVTPENYPTSESNVQTIMQWIMDERFVELAGEGQRWWDLKRWHESGDINLTGWTGGDQHFSSFLASPVQFDVNKHLRFPLPQDEIDRNSAIIDNNPGY
ncbi:MAG TPA: RagB/SusD family nutrient uptake outer membrane protein [Membranihabitans sp.]|nr:RagB/SusD family nutrient uptake outer membrane protein [Membranihabitans sp.]